MSIPTRFTKLLRLCCVTPKSVLFSKILPRYGLGVVTHKGQRYAWKQGYATTAPLFVCHADTVQNGGEIAHAYSIRDNVVTSLALDDRLGLALILYSLETLPPDILPSVLICDDEEIGRSSARVFNEPIAPNWMMEFDRRGTDAVLYDYDSPMWRSILESFDFRIGDGSFSDISYLEHYGVCGVNVGVGYHGEHSPMCYANLADTFANYARALGFYSAMRGVRLAYEPYPDTFDQSYGYARGPRYAYSDPFDDEDLDVDNTPSYGLD